MKGVKAVPPGSPPLVKAQKVPPVAAVLSSTFPPGRLAALRSPVAVTAANGVIFRLDPSGQEVMKGAAREKTDRTPRGVSNGEGTATILEAARMNVWWRASTVRISPAVVRIAGDLSRGAAPRYLKDVSWELIS